MGTYIQKCKIQSHSTLLRYHLWTSPRRQRGSRGNGWGCGGGNNRELIWWRQGRQWKLRCRRTRMWWKIKVEGWNGRIPEMEYRYWVQFCVINQIVTWYSVSLAYVKCFEHHHPTMCTSSRHRHRFIIIIRRNNNIYLIKYTMTQRERKSNIKRQNNGYILKNKSTGEKSMAVNSSEKNHNTYLNDATSVSK